VKYIIAIHQNNVHIGYFCHENTNVPRVYHTWEKACKSAQRIESDMSDIASSTDDEFIMSHYNGLQYTPWPASAFSHFSHC